MKICTQIQLYLVQLHQEFMKSLGSDNEQHFMVYIYIYIYINIIFLRTINQWNTECKQIDGLAPILHRSFPYQGILCTERFCTVASGFLAPFGCMPASSHLNGYKRTTCIRVVGRGVAWWIIERIHNRTCVLFARLAEMAAASVSLPLQQDRIRRFLVE